ncbi:MAG: hypothetical protein WAZ12_05045 [Candidatus Absconditicoccaceae bacterium]
MNNSETSIGGHIKSAGKKFYHGLIGKLSLFDITKIVSYNDINGNPKQDRPELNGNISHIYIGKMNEEEVGIYSDDFLKGILLYYIGATTEGEKISLELANCVSEVLGENMEGFMDFKKQKESIEDLIKKNFGKKIAKTIDIIDLESRHLELFAELRKYEKKIKTEAVEKGLSIGELDQTPSFDKFEFLDYDKAPKLPDYEFSFSSLDIAKYLYRVCKNNALFFDKIKAIKPEKAKSEFYPIIEIAIRLTDFLNGVNIQGGATKQKHYDAIIREIINPYKNISQYPEIVQLREFCKQRIGDRSFETIYMDGNSKKYRAFTEKINSEKASSSKIKIYTRLLALASLTTIWTPKVIDHYRTKELQQQTQETIKEIFENKRLTRSGEYGRGEYTGKEKIERTNKYIDNIYNRFLLRYGSTGKLDSIAFKAKIADRINDQEVLDMLGSSGYGSDVSPIEDIVIDDYIIAKDRGEFRTLGINTTPYSQYLKHTDAFINTILLEKDFETNRDESLKTAEYRGISNTMKVVDNIGPYSPKYQGYYPSITYVYQLAKIKKGGKDYIVATGSPSYRDFKKSEYYELYSSRGKEFAIDFLRQTYPVINQILDQYLIRYYRFYSNSLNITEDGSFKAGKETLRSDLIELLIKDFLKKGLLYKTKADDIKTIINYIDTFVIENNQTLKNMNLGINEKLLPNGNLDRYEDEIKNTLNIDHPEKEKIQSQYIRSTRGELQKDYVLEEILGRYISSEGNPYFIGLTKVDGKTYICAREEFPSDYYTGRYYTLKTGEIIAQDYFKTKSDFLQKKILLEKKLKSASQTHVNVNEKSKPDIFTNYIKNNP